MVINITLGFAMFDRRTPDAARGFDCAGLACAKAENPADRTITTAKERLHKKVEKRPNIRLVRRRLLLGAPPLLICFGRESLGGQRFG